MKANAALLQVLDHVHQMAHRPTQAIQPPHYERIATAQCFVARMQPGPVLACSRKLVAEQVFFSYPMSK
jgi:hypothetical protein